MKIVIFLVIAAPILWFLLSMNRSKKQTDKHKNKREICKYAGASINFQPDACDAVKKLEGKRFLAKEAPTLPLQECNAEECHCRYDHFKDRRNSPEEDRRNKHGTAQNIIQNANQLSERRGSRGRRSTD